MIRTGILIKLGLFVIAGIAVMHFTNKAIDKYVWIPTGNAARL